MVKSEEYNMIARTISILRKIEKLADIFVKNGVEDGFYTLSEYTCDGNEGCSVGKPLGKECSGCTPANCGKYFLSNIKGQTARVKITGLMQFIKEVSIG